MKTANSWKTTLIGAIGAVATAIIPVLQTGHFTLETLAIAAVIALLGWFAKDHNVSGNPPVNVDDPETKI